MTPSQRLARQAERHEMSLATSAEEADLIIRGDHIYGTALFAALSEAAPGTVLTDDLGRAMAARCDDLSRDWALALLDHDMPSAALPAQATGQNPMDLAGQHNARQRKKAPPLLRRAANRKDVEQALFDDSYKGVTDLVTKHLWPPLALPATRWCALNGITPNQVTYVGAALVVAAFVLFWHGLFALGLIAAWVMTFLDTVDGKLARVTLQSSRIGDVMDHGIDLIHPPFWYWAWAVGCAAIGDPMGDGGWTLGIIVVGYILQRIEEGVFLSLFGMEIHVWRRFDSLFRQVTARRNPNMLILTLAAMLGAPREGLIVVAAWTALCFLVHLARIGQAFAARRNGPLISWLAEA